MCRSDFVVRQLCEKFLAKEREVYFAFMDLEKAYDKIDRKASWQVVSTVYCIWSGREAVEGIAQFV